jgi:hypothetical protein
MKSGPDRKNIVRAVIELREAAEAHGRAQQAARDAEDAASRLHLLDTRISVDESMARAVAACSTCGRLHCDEHG